MRNKEEENICENATFTGTIFFITEFDHYCLHKHAQLSEEVVPSSFLCDKKRMSWKKILRYIHTAVII